MNGWRFLLDENIDPKVTTYLKKEGIHAVHVRDSVGLGASDRDDIVPFARSEDLIIVTSDVSDFGILSPGENWGIILLYDDTMPAFRVAGALLSMVDTYPSRGSFAGREVLDSWAKET